MRHRATTLVAALTLGLALEQAQAQPIAQDLELQPEFNLTLKGLSSAQPPRMSLRRSPSTNNLQLVVSSTGKKPRDLSIVEIPAWLRQEGYRFEVTLKPATANKTYVLFEALPLDEDLSSGGSTTLQLAWLVERGSFRGATTAWAFIAQASFSDLDGGQVLEFRQHGKKWGLYRQRPLPSMRFCGLGQEKTMDLERFVPEQSSFVLELDLDKLKEDAKQLQAYLPSRAFGQPALNNYYLWRAATSDLRNRADTGSTIIRPLELGDRNIQTAWRDGSEALGRGEFVSARIEPSVPLKGLRIFPGHGQSQEQYQSHATPKRLLLGLSTGQRYVVDLPQLAYAELSKREGLLIELPQPEQTTCLSVLILEAYPALGPAPKAADFKLPREYEEAKRARSAVAISEITPFSLVHGLEPKAASKILIQTYKAEPNDMLRQRLAIMARPFGRELSSRIREALMDEQPSEQERVRLVALLANLPGTEAIDLLLELVTKADIKSEEYRTIKLSLYAHRAEAAGPLFALIERLPPEEDRRSTDLIRLFGRIATGPQLEQLIPALGQGTELVRNERVRAIAGGDVSMIEPLIEAAQRWTDAQPGEDALKSLSTIGRRQLNPRVLSEAQQDKLIQIAKNAKRRRFKLRTIQALERFAVDRAAPHLREALLLSSPDTLIRSAAARALGAMTHPDAIRGLKESLVDSSPDVRISGMDAIALRKDRHSFEDAVYTYATREHWRRGLESALLFLAQSEDEAKVDVVRKLINATAHVDHALVAARALSRARRGLTQEQAQGALFSPSSPFALRHQIVELLGYAQDAGSRQLLLKLIEAPDALQELEEPKRVDDLRQAALFAIGQRRDMRDVKLLIDCAIQEPNPRLKEAALRALSFYQEARVIAQIEAAKPKLGPTLLNEAQNAQDIIKRRISINEAAEDLKKSSVDTSPK